MPNPSSSRDAGTEDRIFQDLFTPRRTPLRWVAFSAAGHLGIGYLLVAYSAFVAAHPLQKPPDLNTARILELNVNDLQPYIPRPPAEPHKPFPAPVPPRPPMPHTVPQLTAPQLKPEPVNSPLPADKVREYIPPPLQVSDAPKIARAPETLIQLDIPHPELQTNLQVPDALILTNSPRRVLPRPVFRPPDLPKKADVARVVVEMDLPKIQDAQGDLPVAKLLTDHTALPARPASKAPISGTAPTAAEVATGNSKSEEAPALIAIPENPIPVHAAVVVPPAVQMGARGNGNPPIQAGPPAQAGQGGAAGSAQGGQPAAAAELRGKAASPRPAAVLPEVAQIHLPKDGKYPVVVSQSAAAVPGSADFLRGRPVYTVYLRVGARKDWILQYCLPGEPETSRRSSRSVAAANPPPIEAPYAYTILRPAIAFAAPGIRFAMIHGTINQSGRLEELKEVGDQALVNAPALMQALSGWEFRPATKDGVPVTVEILICIPNTSG